nr:S46 family peptidase [Chitinophagaceae bacterium]
MKVKLLFGLLFLFTRSLSAKEGMWLPFLLEKMNEKEMKSMGLKITAKDIYDVNKGSLKDAVVIFGGGCTGEVIS